MAELYVRQELAATRGGVPDPALEVECWLDRLEDVLRSLDGGVTAVPAPQEAYDLLALWAKLNRVRPELIARCDGHAELQRAEAVVEEQGRAAAELALTVLAPVAWQQAAATLETSIEDLTDPAAETELAVELLEDLDEAELVLAAARHLGAADPQLEAAVEQCVDWLCLNADLFLAASVYAQAVGMAMQPDLQDQDYELACTALKYVHLLDAAVEAEAELSLAHVEPLPAPVVRGLYERYLKEREQSTVVPVRRFRTEEILPPAAIPALAADSAAGGAPERRLRWKSMDGRFLAEMYVPRTPTRKGDDEPLTLVLYRSADNSFAVELAGERVRVGGAVPRHLDEQAAAEIRLAELRLAEEISLFVGSDDQEWLPTDEL